MLSTKKPHIELEHPIEILPYEIDSFSSYTASFHPNNIMEDKPSEQSSQHVTNLKQFKVYGGLTPNNMIELLHSGLRNNPRPESFRLKYRMNQVLLPCQYIKIVPIVAYSPEFSFSIWYVELKGIRDREFVQKAYFDYNNYLEREAIKLCLKHFRQRNYLDASNALQSKTHMLLEDPFITELHAQLVTNGDFQAAENIMIEASYKGLFGEYIRGCSYSHLWKKIEATDADGNSPCMRGGHQMCIDVEARLFILYQAGHIYLLGGWDGSNDLSDFWVYDVNNKNWALISADTEVQGGPNPRSNHKMCLDPSKKCLYVLGRFIDRDVRADANFNSDFYRYDIRNNEWELICENTASVGGPQLVYDHQMCIDSEAQIIYVFGGRTMPQDSENFSYSGLYTYTIPTKEWKLIRSNNNSSDDLLQLKSRIGHSMLFDQHEKLLYIIGGDRDNLFLSDFFIYDIRADTIHELTAEYATLESQEAIFTQRTTFDADTQEFFVLSGLKNKDKKEKGSQIVKNSFWVYDLHKCKWTRIYQSDAFDMKYWEDNEACEPHPRHAHQMVYDSVHKAQYIFGGRTVETDISRKQRLDDFWVIYLIRPEPDNILRRIKFQIRKQRFWEMCLEGDSIKALKYLQNQLSQVVDHTSETESEEFRGLTSNLFYNIKNDIDLFDVRTELFEKLLEFFPDEMKQPKGNLIDLATRRDVEQLLKLSNYPNWNLGIHYTGNRRIRRFNRDHRKIDEATDILSFPLHKAIKPGILPSPLTEEHKYLGDLIVSIPYVSDWCKANGENIYSRLTVLYIHGICHLIGYDHETDEQYEQMNSREQEILKQFLEWKKSISYKPREP
ncbi:16163_t:CDS:10 [Acaulospora morrowiae]|uniref:16163_t:CDS:1 n=1 Tax=Acaulospora morrowiae TaxID=94023 RepID=A0A9N8ZL10_9GLOM|nr:16163_t:CDS:10 [Acaulospora morrowiae]